MQPATVHPALLVATLVVFWFGGAALMSRLAGWHRLSALYPAPLHFRSEELRFCTVVMGSASFPISYRRCVRVLLNDDGLGLCLMFPFRFHSPPFFAPWTAVISCTEKQSLTNRKVTFSFAGTNRQLTLAGPLGQHVRARYLERTAGQAPAPESTEPLPPAPGSLGSTDGPRV